jgi:phospholipid/cholesterol/gamma-HCH transport system permease protein
MSTSSLTWQEGERRVFVAAHGVWTAERASVLETDISGFPWRDGTKVIEIDLTDVVELDTYGVWLLEKFQRELGAAGREVRLTNVAGATRALFDEMKEVNRSNGAGPQPMSALELYRIGMLAFSRDLVGFAGMLGATANAFFAVLVRPGRFRFTSTIHQLDRVGWQALPVVLIVTLIIGAIIAQQGFFHFSGFGADLYVIDMIGFLIMREIGILLVSIMVAGRSGSAFAAELGSMRMREEVDALRTMGLDPVAVLILPRTLALVIALPILTFIGAVSALFGAGLVAVFYAGISPDLFVERLREAISLDHLKVGLIKAPFIGLMIGVIASTEGFRVSGSAASLGRHTTQSVVKSIFMVIVIDGLFALFFSGIGM